MRATLGYATIGGIIDALQGNNKTDLSQGASPRDRIQSAILSSV